MTITNDGKNRIKDLLSADITVGTAGTDSTSVTVNDTDLGAAVAVTEAVVTKTTGNKLINSTHIIKSTDANGEVLNEFGLYVNSGTVLLDRVVYPDFNKTQSVELHTVVTTRII